MIDIQINSGAGSKHILSAKAPLDVKELQEHVAQLTGWNTGQFYILCNGRLTYDDDICQSGCVQVVPRLFGGKGGFGSMLRAIGAQIEKTTNREACRDLSGRRLRDINEEKRLKAWIEKQGTREEEAAERKKKKLQRLCAEPRHEFKDQTYERERSILTERVGDAVEQGFQAAVTLGEKRKHEEAPKPIRKKTLLDFDMDSDELDSSDSEAEEIKEKKLKASDNQSSNDSGHSSDESVRNNKDQSDQAKDDCEGVADNKSSTETSCDSIEQKTSDEHVSTLSEGLSSDPETVKEKSVSSD